MQSTFYFFQSSNHHQELLDDIEITKRLPREILLRIFSFLDVVSLCRCAQVSDEDMQLLFKYIIFFLQILLQVSKQWNILALDGSNWQKIDLFDFQRDIEVSNMEYMADYNYYLISVSFFLFF